MVRILHPDDIVYTIQVFWIYSLVPIFLIIPAVFMLANHCSDTRRCSYASKIANIILEDSRFHRFIAITMFLSMVALSISILSLHDFTRGFVEEILMRLGYHKHLFKELYTFYSITALFIAQLLLPITTLLMVLVWYLIALILRRNIALFVLAIWFAFRIGLMNAFLTETDLNVQDHPGARTVFGSFIGLWVCVVFSAGSVAISRLLLRNARPATKVLVIGACLCPLIVLIWGASEISIGWLTIDFAITAFILGWLLSAVCRPASVRGDIAPVDRIEMSPTIPSVSPSPRKWFVAGGFLLVAVFPSIMSKWAFHSLLGLSLDGAVKSWATIWAVALALGFFAFTTAIRYECRGRAGELGTAAFLSAFAIMIFNWGAESDDKLMAYVNDVSVVFTMPVLLLGMLALIATIVLDTHRWTWPFWACYLFAYIFVHSMSGSGYVNDLSKFDLFSWINMSAIVFIFLFAIPICFARAYRSQQRTLVTFP